MTGRALLRAETEVGASPERLWDVLADWSRQGEWIPLTSVRSVRGGGHGVGGRIEAWTGIGPIGFTDPMVITHWDPPQRCEVLHLGAVVRGEGGFEVLAAGAGARVVWWESVELPLGPVGRAGWRLSERMVHMGLELSLARLRRLAEGEAG
ncbi:MAG TPA: SRPBCC family protein [Nocardioidaceae bacterium]|nr:SRPBCC family protein [Nocardioidaceae bacterium]